MRIRGGIGVALPVAGGSSNAVKHAAKDDGKKDMSDKVCWHRVDDIDGDDCYGFLTDVIVFPLPTYLKLFDFIVCLLLIVIPLGHLT